MRKAINYGRQNIIQEDIDAVVEVMKSEYLTQGPKISEFETAFANYIGVKYAVAVSNGTAALHLSALAAGIKKGDKVITTPITFAASANCVRYAGGNLVFADIDPKTYLLDIYRVREILEKNKKGTFKGIIPVDFSGRAINLQELYQLASNHGLWIIEDACHAPGGYFIDNNGKKQRCGNGRFAELAIFSFHPVKHITCGEGGMVTTNDEKLYQKLILLRTHGITKDPLLLKENHGLWYYEMQELGYNYRLTDMQASLGISQLRRANEGLKRRIEIATIYNNAFQNKGFIKGQSGLVKGHAYHLYILEVENRKGLYDHLIKNKIYSQVHYIPVHLMPYYRKYGWKEGDFPNAEKYYTHCISLPMFPTLKDKEQNYIIRKILDFYEP